MGRLWRVLAVLICLPTVSYAQSTRVLSGSLDDNGSLNIVANAYQNNVSAHMDIDAVAGTDYDIILVDISDTVNYPHGGNGTDYIQLEYLYVDIDAESNASYNIHFGWLENVDDANGDFYEIAHISGNKTVGQNIKYRRHFAQYGPELTTLKTVTSDIDLNDVTYQTDVNLRSTIDPATADTPSGNGDFVMAITSTATSNDGFEVEVEFGYHTR